jgi:hypothetical protein
VGFRWTSEVLLIDTDSVACGSDTAEESMPLCLF